MKLTRAPNVSPETATVGEGCEATKNRVEKTLYSLFTLLYSANPAAPLLLVDAAVCVLSDGGDCRQK